MSKYRLYVNGEKTAHVTEASRPGRGLEQLVADYGLTLANHDGQSRYGHTDDGVSVMALTEPYGRRRLDPLERTTRL